MAKFKGVSTSDGQTAESWESLNALNPRYLNNTEKADAEILFFNRVPKVGSEALFELMQNLQNLNNIYVDKSGIKKGAGRLLDTPSQRELAYDILDLSEGSVYTDHVAWIDFKKFNLPKPIFINLVRDPVERVISWFYYIRGSYRNAIFFRKNPQVPNRSTKWYKKDFNKCVRESDRECQYIPITIDDPPVNIKRQSGYFCGHHDDCQPFNSPVAVQMAKERVEREYAVVGSWEDTNITLTVFEKYIPRFFHGVRNIYELHQKQISNRNKNHRKPKVDEDVKEMIRKNFTHEFDFYYFCKQRLYKQYLAINLQHLKNVGL